MTTRSCDVCGKSKPTSEFAQKGRLCAACRNSKLCKVCGIVKSKTEFVAEARACATCADKKKCNTCGETKTRSDFDGTRLRCKACEENRPCAECGVMKHRTEFYGVGRLCKICHCATCKASKKVRVDVAVESPDDPIPVFLPKKCVRCTEIKPASEYDDKNRTCRACLALPKEFKSKAKPPPTEKICRRCGITKPAVEFNGMSTTCATCLERTCDGCGVKKPRTEYKSAAHRFCKSCQAMPACDVCRERKPRTEYAGQSRVCIACCSERPCNQCGVVKTADAYEGLRRTCEECRWTLKMEDAKTKNPEIDRESIPKPEACVGCGLGRPDVDFGWRDDVASGGWRSKCTKCASVNSEGVTNSKAYRDREMKKDPVGFRERMAIGHYEYVHRDVDNWYTQWISTQKAKYKNTWDSLFDEADVEMVKRKIQEPCHYCGREKSEGEMFNGLDRMVPGGKYDDVNTVSCCKWCNYMKLALSINEFIRKVRCAVARPRDFGWAGFVNQLSLDEIDRHVECVHSHTKLWVLGL